MLKHRVTDIYSDDKKLFSTNQLILTDERLGFLADDLSTFDLIAKYDYGAREFFTSFLDDTELDYKLSDIHEAIYMNLLKNLRKYRLMYLSDADGEEIIPSADYKITREYGEEEKHFNYGSKQETNTFGEKTTTDTLGQGQQTITTAPRSKDSQDQRTTFDSTDDFDTTHNVTGTIQTVDTIADAQKINTEVEGQQVVTKVDANHSDGVVYDEHTDNVYGYKGNPSKNIQAFRKYLNDNTIKTIVDDCVNTVTYSIYMYIGQM